MSCLTKEDQCEIADALDWATALEITASDMWTTPVRVKKLQRWTRTFRIALEEGEVFFCAAIYNSMTNCGWLTDVDTILEITQEKLDAMIIRNQCNKRGLTVCRMTERLHEVYE